MSQLLDWSLTFAQGCLVLAMLLTLTRAAIGPRAQDRVMALESTYTSGMLLMLVLGLTYRSSMYFEAALLISLLGFTGTIAMAKFLLRGEVIE